MPRLRSFLVAGFAAIAIAGVACDRSSPDPIPAVADSAAPSALARGPRPPSRETLRTTDGTIALGNLDGQIRSLGRILDKAAEQGAAATSDVASRRRAAALGPRRRDLVELLLVRADVRASVTDLEAALAVADRWVSEAPDSGDARLARASAESALHRFDDAGRDLDEAVRLGISADRVVSARATILQAKGDLDAALPLREQAATHEKNIGTLGSLAALLAEIGRTDEASAKFDEAASLQRDTSPFPLAWLFHQRGLALERAGDNVSAEAFLAAALERVPAYAHAAAHLGRVLPRDRAIALLTGWLDKWSNPNDPASDVEIEAVLADQLRRAGRAGEAEPHIRRATEQYNALVLRQPKAYADHAAAFFLGEGNDPARAKALAEQALSVRKTTATYQQAFLAALAAGDKPRACEIGKEGAARPHASGMFKQTVSESCP